MRSAPFKQVDVFTHTPFKGNPVAVVMQADDLSTEQMQQIANWTHLSETTFVLPPTDTRADYRLRIFTPAQELPFAGHPTIGTAHALLEGGLITPRHGQLVQECAAGLVALQVEMDPQGQPWISFDLPSPTLTRLTPTQVDELEAILGHAVSRDAWPCLIDVGPRWIVAQLPSAQAVLACQPDLVRMTRQDTQAQATGVVIFGEHPSHHASRIEVRAFAPSHGVNEDPVCGSGNGCVGAFIRASGLLPHFGQSLLASQGAALGRAGRVRITMTETRIQVSGQAVTCVEGRLSY
ncbi:MAG: PhzF family phenazine biosynthesis protein [Burkholderiales bacterium]|nr:PhzF family phenazine biosynthesis protein [Burkholderiales bacterium]